MSEKLIRKTVVIVMACFVLHNIFHHFNDNLFYDENDRRDRNDYVQAADEDDEEPNQILRRAAKKKRHALASLVYEQ
ncbi:unnamed protein product [Aphanomyces euteiches]